MNLFHKRTLRVLAALVVMGTLATWLPGHAHGLAGDVPGLPFHGHADEVAHDSHHHGDAQAEEAGNPNAHSGHQHGGHGEGSDSDECPGCICPVGPVSCGAGLTASAQAGPAAAFRAWLRAERPHLTLPTSPPFEIFRPPRG